MIALKRAKAQRISGLYRVQVCPYRCMAGRRNWCCLSGGRVGCLDYFRVRAYVFRGDPLEKLHSLWGVCRHLWAGCRCSLFAVGDRQVIDGGAPPPRRPLCPLGARAERRAGAVLCCAVLCCAVLCRAVQIREGYGSEPWVRDGVPQEARVRVLERLAGKALREAVRGVHGREELPW